MKLLGETLDPAGNFRWSLRRYRVWWLILLASMVFDALTTAHFVQQHGAGAEMNLVIRWLLRNIGLWPGLMVGKLLQLIAVAVFVSLHRRLGNLLMLVVIVLNCWAVAVNVR